VSPEEKVEKWLNEIWANKPFGAHAGVTVPKEAIANLLAKLAIAEEALRFYTGNGERKAEINGLKYTLQEYGCGCCAGAFDFEDGHYDPEITLEREEVQGFTAREALKKIRGEP
jgi:hypothetical protein